MENRKDALGEGMGGLGYTLLKELSWGFSEEVCSQKTCTIIEESQCQA